MSKKTVSKRFNLILLSLLVIGLAVGLVALNRVQDNRGHAAGTKNRNQCGDCVGDFQCAKGYRCAVVRETCSWDIPAPGGAVSAYGWCTPVTTKCGGKRGACAGTCPSGQSCEAPSVLSNGDACSCHPTKKPKATAVPTKKPAPKPTKSK